MLEDLGLIGNCQISALVRRDGAIVWSCLPRFDADPVFGALLDAESGGSFQIASVGYRHGTQHYDTNTNILITTLTDDDGTFRIIDFAPRFVQYERSFRPTMLVRIIEPISGTPRVRVACRPVLGWTKLAPQASHGSHHVSYRGYADELRLTTDISLSCLDGEPFSLTQRRHFVLSWGEPVHEPLEPLCARFLHATRGYWQRWVKHCEVPPHYQAEVIRSALTLKLHCYEDTGAIVAALTTSVPEAPDSGRTWDYRYCWLRDAYYALGAFRLLGHFEEREQFLEFLLNVASGDPGLRLAPLYRIDGKRLSEERCLTDWKGYRGQGPVRVGNSAALHQQHDVFGEMVMALTPLFLDERFASHVSPSVLELVTQLARRAAEVAGTPDAGIWEFRNDWHPQTFSSLMCWAGVDRMTHIAQRHVPALVDEFTAAAKRIRQEICERAVSPTRGCLVAAYDGSEVDAALLQAVTLRFLPADDPRLQATVDAIIQELDQDGWLRRYRIDDGFGTPQVSFMLCTFWLVEALARLGRVEQARHVMARLRGVTSPLGLLAEDVMPASGIMWGNFPQAYSHVGLIHAAFAASPSWTDVGG